MPRINNDKGMLSCQTSPGCAVIFVLVVLLLGMAIEWVYMWATQGGV